MTETEARTAITAWAKQHFAENEEDITPIVDVLSITYDEQEDEWEAELEVSTSVDNPHITFFMSDSPKHELQIVSVEY